MLLLLSFPLLEEDLAKGLLAPLDLLSPEAGLPSIRWLACAPLV